MRKNASQLDLYQSSSSPAHSASSPVAQRRRLQEKQRLERSRRAAALMADAAELYLVRHGATDWNVEGRIQGQMEPGPGLNQEGQAQVRGIA